MGRGMRLIGWIKKHFMRIKKPRNKKRRVKHSASRESFPSVNHNLNNTSVNTSIDTTRELKKDKLNDNVKTPTILEEASRDQYWDDDDDASVGEYVPNQRNFVDNILSEGEYSGTSYEELLTEEPVDQPQLLSELTIISSTLSGIAFRVLWAQKSTSQPSPPANSSPNKDRKDWGSKIETATKNKQNVFGAIRLRCQERNQRGMAVRARKAMPHTRPLAHGYSLLAELPSTPVIFIRPPTQGGVAFDVLNLPDIDSPTSGGKEPQEEDEVSSDSDEKTVSPLMAQEFVQLPKRLQDSQQTVFDDEFLKKKEAKLCRAEERRQQHLEAVKEKQKLIAAQGEAARLRYLTVSLSDVPEEDEDAEEDEDPEEDEDAGEDEEEAASERDTPTQGGDGGQSKTRTRSDEEKWGVPSLEQTCIEQQHALVEAEREDVDEDDDNSSPASSDESECSNTGSSEESDGEVEESNVVSTQADGEVTNEQASANGSGIKTESKMLKSILLIGRKASQSEESGSSKDSLANRSKIRRNISFNRNVRVLQFTKDLYSERTSSTELMEDFIKPAQNIKAISLRTRRAAYFKPPQARQRRHRLSELRALERAKKNASCVSAYLLSSSNHSNYEDEEDEEEEEEEEEDEDCDCQDSDDCSTNTSYESYYSPNSNGGKQDDEDGETEWEKRFRPLKLPPTLVFPPLPLRYASNVDTRDKEEVPSMFQNQYPPNSHPILRRRYFVYKNDRRRRENYNLASDDIVRNPRRDDPGAAQHDRPQRGEILEDPLRELVDDKIKTHTNNGGSLGEHSQMASSNISVVHTRVHPNHSNTLMLSTPPLQPRSLAGIGRRPFRLKPINLTEDASNRDAYSGRSYSGGQTYSGGRSYSDIQTAALGSRSNSSSLAKSTANLPGSFQGRSRSSSRQIRCQSDHHINSARESQFRVRKTPDQVHKLKLPPVVKEVSSKKPAPRKLMDRREHQQPSHFNKPDQPSAKQTKPRFYLPALHQGPITCQPADINVPPEERGKQKSRNRK